MIIRFEEQNANVEPTAEWAIAEGEGTIDRDVVVVPDAEGTPGQQFRAHLMTELFDYLNLGDI
jgi:hypothetical protein